MTLGLAFTVAAAFAAAAPIHVEDSPYAPPTCSGDWTRAANDQLRSMRSPGITYGNEPLTELVFGRDCTQYNVTGPLHIFGARIRGVSAGTVIHCVDVRGACIQGHYPDTVVGPGSYQVSGDRYSGLAGPLRIEDLVIRGTRLPDSVGIMVRWGFTAQNVVVERFGTGIDMTCTARPNPPETPANCNSFYLNRIFVFGNVKNGVQLSGADVNAGTAIGLVASHNGGWGWWSDSFLGNTLIAPQFDGNGEGAIFISGVSARSVVVGLYVEGRGVVDVRAPSVVLQATGGYFTQRTRGVKDGYRVLGGLQFVDRTGDSSLVAGGEPNTYLTMSVKDDPHPVRMKHVGGLGWLLDHANLGSRQALIITTSTSPAHLPRGRTWFRHGALYGPSGLREIYVATERALPDPRTLPPGSRAWVTAPAIDAPALWVVHGTADTRRWQSH